MKKTLVSTTPEASWRHQLASFDAALKARGMSEKTRRAYGTDVEQLADWAAAQGMAPHDASARVLRRFAGVLSERGLSKTSVARKLASIRSFYRHMVHRGELTANPADLIATPKRDSYLPRVLKPGEVADVLDRIPAGSPLELRDRAIFELAYGAGLRAEELVNLDVTDLDPDAEELRVTGKGSKTRVVPAGEPAWRALETYLDRSRGALAKASETERAEPALFLSKSGRRLSTSDGRRRCSARRAPAGSRPRTCAAGCGSRPAVPAPGRASHRTRCATRSPLTCSREEPTCGRSRSSSGTRASVRLKPTLG